MTDPMAPDNYCFENQDKLDACLEVIREAADELDHLSFGDAASDIQRAVYKIEHHTKEDYWTRVSRAGHNYVRKRIGDLKAPHVSLRRGFNGARDSVEVSFSIPIPEGSAALDFVNTHDPGNPFDKECPVCLAQPKHPCGGSVEDGLPTHARRRFPDEDDSDVVSEIDYDDYPHARGHEKDVYKTEDGVLRYRENKVIGWLQERGGSVMNEVAVMHQRGLFSMEDMMEFYRLIGYSLSGFEEIWHEKDPATRTPICQGGDNVVERGKALCEECS
jgi:hypothetical protein